MKILSRCSIGLSLVLMLNILFSVMFPSHGGDRARDHIYSTERSIVEAITAYQKDYDHLPGDRPDGRYEDAEGNAQIFRVLRGLDLIQNPRHNRYFDEKNARLRKGTWGDSEIKLRNGFDPKTGVLLDPYGNPYRIRLSPSVLEPVVSPYRDRIIPQGPQLVWSLDQDGKPANYRHEPVEKVDALVWSLGRDGKQDSATDLSLCKDSDDILEWAYF